ncbi:MAG: CDP-diacylglycerol--serine O-phosphatidyltransferase [Candidatus Methanoperedens sp.]|nr:CDP-diacylglycerol--serine O-phosphatidyltransferase [Candidatus Methanoperedens sp.]MCE8424975.1 CDP-diacylglycerol--serine O-phosphatidyltransferase [Candidatus Methanoperedens sp.]MCE8427409.1 CDP-diacylglycerol--serine O-phosphatidyltransferase [Candidatus Methanoperedens sp.]
MTENILKMIQPADIITIFNALFGFASIIMVIHGQFDGALILILLAVIADAADGAVARFTGTGVLGANLDSLADVISFGVAPAVATFVYLGGWLSAIFASLFLSCGMLRLARFNVEGKKDGFEGIPITAGGFIVALFLFVRDYFMAEVFIIMLVIVSLLMVSTIGYPKLKTPVLVAPMGIILILEIVMFFTGNMNVVRIASIILLLFMFAYIVSPIVRKYYE